MAMRATLFTVAFALAACCAFLSYNAINLILDPYNVVWHRQIVPKQASIIEQFRNAKIRYLANHPDRYDGVVLADSRGTANKTTEFNRASGRHYFNLAASGDSPIGFVQKARWLIKTQTNLRDVVIFLSFDQFQNIPQHDALMLREHPDVSGESWLSYYWTFSNLPYKTFWSSLSYYLKNLMGLATDPASIVNSGFDEDSGDVTIWGRSVSNFTPTAKDRAEFEERAKADPPGLLRFHDSVLEPSGIASLRHSFAAPIREEQRDSFVELIALLKHSTVEAHCVVVPLAAATLALVPLEKYLEWMHFVVDRCGQAWDFSFPNSITRDNYNFADWAHFRAHVGNMVVSKVSGVETSTVTEHSDFGRYISSVDFPQYAAEWQQDKITNALGH